MALDIHTCDQIIRRRYRKMETAGKTRPDDQKVHLHLLAARDKCSRHYTYPNVGEPGYGSVNRRALALLPI